MIDIQFIEFYIRKKYNQNLVEYFSVSKPTVSVWRSKSAIPVSRVDEFMRREKGFDIHELFERIYQREG